MNATAGGDIIFKPIKDWQNQTATINARSVVSGKYYEYSSGNTITDITKGAYTVNVTAPDGVVPTVAFDNNVTSPDAFKEGNVYTFYGYSPVYSGDVKATVTCGSETKEVTVANNATENVDFTSSSNPGGEVTPPVTTPKFTFYLDRTYALETTFNAKSKENWSKGAYFLYDCGDNYSGTYVAMTLVPNTTNVFKVEIEKSHINDLGKVRFGNAYPLVGSGDEASRRYQATDMINPPLLEDGYLYTLTLENAGNWDYQVVKSSEKYVEPTTPPAPTAGKWTLVVTTQGGAPTISDLSNEVVDVEPSNNGNVYTYVYTKEGYTGELTGKITYKGTEESFTIANNATHEVSIQAAPITYTIVVDGQTGEIKLPLSTTAGLYTATNAFANLKENVKFKIKSTQGKEYKVYGCATPIVFDTKTVITENGEWMTSKSEVNNACINFWPGTSQIQIYGEVVRKPLAQNFTEAEQAYNIAFETSSHWELGLCKLTWDETNKRYHGTVHASDFYGKEWIFKSDNFGWSDKKGSRINVDPSKLGIGKWTAMGNFNDSQNITVSYPEGETADNADYWIDLYIAKEYDSDNIKSGALFMYEKRTTAPELDYYVVYSDNSKPKMTKGTDNVYKLSVEKLNADAKFVIWSSDRRKYALEAAGTVDDNGNATLVVGKSGDVSPAVALNNATISFDPSNLKLGIAGTKVNPDAESKVYLRGATFGWTPGKKFEWDGTQNAYKCEIGAPSNFSGEWKLYSEDCTWIGKDTWVRPENGNIDVDAWVDLGTYNNNISLTTDLSAYSSITVWVRKKSEQGGAEMRITGVKPVATAETVALEDHANNRIEFTKYEDGFKANGVKLNTNVYTLMAKLGEEIQESAYYSTVSFTKVKEKVEYTVTPKMWIPEYTEKVATKTLSKEDAGKQKLYLEEGVYDFVFNPTTFAFTITNNSPAVPANLPEKMYLLGERCNGNWNNKATNDYEMHQMEPGVFCRKVKGGDHYFRFTDGTQGYGPSTDFTIEGGTSTAVSYVVGDLNKAFHVTKLDSNKEYYIRFNLNLSEVYVFEAKDDITVGEASTSYSNSTVVEKNGEKLIVVMPTTAANPDDVSFDAIHQEFSVALGLNESSVNMADVKCVLRPAAWKFADNPDHVLMGAPYALLTSDNEGNLSADLYNVRPGKYMIDLTINGAQKVQIPVSVCYTLAGFKLQGTPVQYTGGYDFALTSDFAWGLGGNAEVYVEGNDFMSGLSLTKQTFYEMYYRFTPGQRAAAPQRRSVTTTGNVTSVDEIPADFIRLGEYDQETKRGSKMQLKGLTVNGGNVEIYMASNGAINPQPYVLNIPVQTNDDIITSVEEIEAAVEAEYFTLDGVRVSSENLAPGIYVVRRGAECTKTVIR